jgi:hypothetical protein
VRKRLQSAAVRSNCPRPVASACATTNFRQSLMGSPTGTDAGATRRWQSILDQVRVAAVREGCARPTSGDEAVLRISESSTTQAHGTWTGLYRRCRKWSDRIESRRDGLLLAPGRLLPTAPPRIARATYTDQTESTATGKDLRVDLTVQNLTDPFRVRQHLRQRTDGRVHRPAPAPVRAERRLGWVRC